MMCIKYATLLPICIFEHFDTIVGDINNQTFLDVFWKHFITTDKDPFFWNDYTMLPLITTKQRSLPEIITSFCNNSYKRISFNSVGWKGEFFFQEKFYDAINVDVQQLENAYTFLLLLSFLTWVRSNIIMQFLFTKIVINLNLIKFITDIHNTLKLLNTWNVQVYDHSCGTSPSFRFANTPVVSMLETIKNGLEGAK